MYYPVVSFDEDVLPLFCAVSDSGDSFGRIWTSETGLTDSWTQQTSPVDASWNEVIFGGLSNARRYVAVSYAQKAVIWSANGRDWINATPNLPVSPPNGAVTWKGILWIEELELWALVNDGNETYFVTSPDLTTWTLRGVRADTGGVSILANQVRYHDGLWLLLGQSEFSATPVRYSLSDGASWATANLDNGFNGGWSENLQKWLAISLGTVAVADTGTTDWATSAIGFNLLGPGDDPTDPAQVYAGGTTQVGITLDGPTWNATSYGSGDNFIGPIWTGAFWFGWQYADAQRCFISDTLTSGAWNQQVQPVHNFNSVATTGAAS
jgi:hypothetical protein